MLLARDLKLNSAFCGRGRGRTRDEGRLAAEGHRGDRGKAGG